MSERLICNQQMERSIPPAGSPESITGGNCRSQAIAEVYGRIRYNGDGYLTYGSWTDTR
jgi:hypothetical protein